MESNGGIANLQTQYYHEPRRHYMTKSREKQLKDDIKNAIQECLSTSTSHG